MHPYSVWIKEIVNAVTRDVLYLKVRQVQDRNQAYTSAQHIFEMIGIEIDSVNVRNELAELSEILRAVASENSNSENISGSIGIRISERFTVALQTVVINDEDVANIFVSGSEYIRDHRDYLPAVSDCFRDSSLRELMSASSRINDASLVGDVVSDTSPDAIHAVNVDADRLTPPRPGKKKRQAFYYSMAFLFFSILALFLDHKFNKGHTEKIDLLVVSLLITLGLYVFYNPLSRYMRIFWGTMTVFIVYQTASTSMRFTGTFGDNQFLLEVANSVDVVAPIGTVLIMVLCLVLDFLNRR